MDPGCREAAWLANGVIAGSDSSSQSMASMPLCHIGLRSILASRNSGRVYVATVTR
jgi:hypothetical protein